MEFIASKPRPSASPLALNAPGSRLVPRDMQRNGRRRSGQLMNDGAVVQLVEDAARLAGAGKAGEARATRADAPGGNSHEELLRPLSSSASISTPRASKICAERVVIGLESRRPLGIFLGNQMLRNLKIGHQILPETRTIGPVLRSIALFLTHQRGASGRHSHPSRDHPAATRCLPAGRGRPAFLAQYPD